MFEALHIYKSCLTMHFFTIHKGHAVLPQIEDIVASYPNVKLAVINQSDVEVIAGELSITLCFKATIIH
jgi:hypothetical protein